jgi:hypothetical protein
MSHPFARRRLRRLQQGISLAAMRAAHVVEAMLMGEV